MDHHMYHHHDQYQHQMTNPYNTIITTQPPPTTTMIVDDEKKMMTSTRPQEPRNCPRCNSSNTKFCYYNNYSLAQPRYLCKSCRRYWTEGGSLRNVPVGGGSRKNKKVPLLLPNSSASTSTSKNLPDLNPPFALTSSSNPNNNTLQNNSDLSLSSSPSKQGQGHYGHFRDGQNSLFQAPMGIIQFRQEYDHHGHNNNKTNLGFSLDKEEIDGTIHKETVWNSQTRRSPDRVFPVWNSQTRRSPDGVFPSGLQHQELKTVENGIQNNFTFNGGGITKMMYPYGDHDDHNHHDDGNKKRESGSSNELWSGIILGGDHSGGPTW